MAVCRKNKTEEFISGTLIDPAIKIIYCRHNILKSLPKFKSMSSFFPWWSEIPMEPFLIRIVAVRLVGSTWWCYTEYTTYYLHTGTGSKRKSICSHHEQPQTLPASSFSNGIYVHVGLCEWKTVGGGDDDGNSPEIISDHFRYENHFWWQFTQSFIIEVDCLISVGDILQSIYQRWRYWLGCVSYYVKMVKIKECFSSFPSSDRQTYNFRRRL